MTRLLQGINLHVIKRKFREKWIVHSPRRKKEQRDLERERVLRSLGGFF